MNPSFQEIDDFYNAVEDGKFDDVKAFITKHPSFADRPNQYGSTPLIFAAGGGHMEIAKYLLSLGANIAAKGWKGWTPLSIARANGHDDMVALIEATQRARKAVQRSARMPKP